MSSTTDAFQNRDIHSSQTAELSIHQLQPKDAIKWDEFVLACPEATFFHRAGWEVVINEAFGHKTYFLYAELDGQIHGVLPLAEINSYFFGHSLCSLPFCVYGGVAANSESARKALDRAAQKLAAKLKVDYLEYRNLRVHNTLGGQQRIYM